MYSTGQPCIGKKIVHESEGHTLLELLLALTIWGLILPVIAGGLRFTVQSYTREVERLEAREQALAVLRNVESEVREGHDFHMQSDGMSFLDAHNHLIQYQLNPRTGLLQRLEQGIGNTIIGAKLTVFRCTLNPTGSLSPPDPALPTIRLELRTQFGRSSVDLSEVLTGRGGDLS